MAHVTPSSPFTTVFSTFVTSQMDSCQALHFGVSQSSLVSPVCPKFCCSPPGRGSTSPPIQFVFASLKCSSVITILKCGRSPSHLALMHAQVNSTDLNIAEARALHVCSLQVELSNRACNPFLPKWNKHLILMSRYTKMTTSKPVGFF